MTAHADHPIEESARNLVGREREQRLLRDSLDAAIGGWGRLVLIGGEAGIGKTTLAEGLCREAANTGVLVLTGRCYDLTETPPYGPWVELFGRYRPADGDPPSSIPPLPAAFAVPDTVGTVSSPAALFRHVRTFFGALATKAPVVLLLDDLHWADPASLDLLRSLARGAADIPLLIIATYRADELTRRHPLYQMLPTLVRESAAVRLDPRPLEADDLRTLIADRYHLVAADVAALAAYLRGRSEGNPFFAAELLRALEEERVLTETDGRWRLGALTAIVLPSLLRQVIDGRLIRLGEETLTLLGIAAVIGQEVPLALWATVAGGDEEALLEPIERAGEARVLAETTDAGSVRFGHALIRETLYEAIPAIQRRRLHRQVGASLVASPYPDPDTVAYHFQRAGDPRAAEWLARAAERAQSANAWLTAADRYEAALALREAAGADAAERGWLLYRLAILRSYIAPRVSLISFEEVTRLATVADDQVLAACAVWYHGFLLLIAGDYLHGLPMLEAGAIAVESLSPADRSRVTGLSDVVTVNPRANVAYFHAIGGQFAKARRLAEQQVADLPPDTKAGASGGVHEQNYAALAWAHTFAGKPTEARQAFARAYERFRSRGAYYLVAHNLMSELVWVMLPYYADDREARRRVANTAVQFYTDGGEVYGDRPARFALAPLLFLEGDWEEARALTLAGQRSTSTVSYRIYASTILAPLARAQGDTDLAWEVVRHWLPAGPETLPGETAFVNTIIVQRVAVALALDANDLAAARQWLDAHDRWLAWSGAVLGQSEGNLLWAHYHRAMGDLDAARGRAEQALAHASAPRQPLALLAAHRLLGELDTDAGRFADATIHLDAALALAGACAAPYERALTLLARAALHHATGDTAGMTPPLDEARAILTRLDAAPALARLGQIALALLTAKPTYPGGLSPREIEVLRLLATSKTNREIAEALFLSEHTVRSHVRSILTKTRTDNRTGAALFAREHGLA